MATGTIRIVDEHAAANIKERIGIILNSYPNFLETMDGFEESLKYLIISGRKMAKRRGREDLGVRVQTSGFNDPIASITVDSVIPTEAIRSGSMDAELKETECPEQYRKEAEVIHEVRDGYFFAKVQIETLPWQNYRVLDSCLNGSHDFVKLAEEADCAYDGMKSRLEGAKNRIRKSTALYLGRKCENN